MRRSRAKTSSLDFWQRSLEGILERSMLEACISLDSIRQTNLRVLIITDVIAPGVPGLSVWFHVTILLLIWTVTG